MSDSATLAAVLALPSRAVHDSLAKDFEKRGSACRAELLKVQSARALLQESADSNAMPGRYGVCFIPTSPHMRSGNVRSNARVIVKPLTVMNMAATLAGVGVLLVTGILLEVKAQ
jgi:hypothetical protein